MPFKANAWLIMAFSLETLGFADHFGKLVLIVTLLIADIAGT
jgi:hypothetical protein